ncbi:MAG TPA: copper oxidase [Micromonosporaceae bacterium]|nr:copper oxidase [Micromonosporaceae bacterium]HCU48615.1 copper oxidase [Micromonosporaceae bacterium]
MTNPNRRRPLRTVLIIGLAVLLICCGGLVALGTWLFGRTSVDTFGKVDFTNRLAIPPLAPSQVDSQGRRVFDLRAQAGNHDFGSGFKSATWGFNGNYLGPTLRATAGEQVLVNVHNSLSENTTVHWHGMHLPPSMDGGPHQQVRAGGNWSPSWKINQPGTTLWYHPHLHGKTAEHVYRGMAGMFILDDPQTTGLALPQRYGVDDIPLIVQDRKFSDGNSRLDEDENAFSDIGVLGDQIVVNGTHSPYLDVTTSLVRLRLLNASNARNYNFGFSDDRQFSLIGTDGGLLAAPAKLTRIQLSAGERAEIMVAVKPGERTVLRSYDPDLGGGIERFIGGDDRFDVLELRAAAQLASAAELPAQLVKVDRLNPDSAKVTRKFKLSGKNINGTQMDMDRIDFVATKDTTEIWEVSNNDGDPHSFHVHDVQFQILSHNGAPPPPHLSGWKDTITVPSETSYRLIMQFKDHSDPNTPYMYHCHVLDHEDKGMMGQFVVVEPGQQPGRPPTHDAHSAHAHH